MKIELNSSRIIGWRIYDINPTQDDIDTAIKIKEILRQIVYQDIIKFGELKKAKKQNKTNV